MLVGGGDFGCGGGDGGFITFTGRGSRFFKLLNYVFCCCLVCLICI